jgi:hypothetical protein
VTKGSGWTAAEDVVDAEDVGEEQAVEQPTLKRLGEVDPAIEATIVTRTIARMPPKTRRLMRYAIHFKGIETNLFRHRTPICKRRLRNRVPFPHSFRRM